MWREVRACVLGKLGCFKSTAAEHPCGGSGLPGFKSEKSALLALARCCQRWLGLMYARVLGEGGWAGRGACRKRHSLSSACCHNFSPLQFYIFLSSSSCCLISLATFGGYIYMFV